MAIDPEDLKENYIVSSLVRGLKILSTFTVKNPSLKVSEIAEMTGLDQATVFRFVYTLEYLGYLVREDETKRYHQSVRMLSLSLPARSGVAVREAALPSMADLSKKINESVKLAVLDGLECVMVAVVEILDKLNYPTPIGYRSPAYCTAQGKVLLAYQPVDDWDRLIARIEFLPRTENTIVDPGIFREELLQVRRQGYSIQDAELTMGLSSVAAPVFDHVGHVAGAINISGMSIQILNEEKIDIYIDELLKTARTVSTRLGYLPAMSE